MQARRGRVAAVDSQASCLRGDLIIALRMDRAGGDVIDYRFAVSRSLIGRIFV